MILGVGVLALLAGAVIAILLGERDGDGVGGSPGASASSSATADGSASASPSASTSATPSASASSSSAPVSLTVGDFVEPAVEGVTLRETPSTTGARIGTLAGGSVNYVVEGPVAADGYTWYRFSAPGLPPSSGCTTPVPTSPLSCPMWFGWAAVQDPADGTAWFVPTDVECPDPATETDEFLRIERWLPVGCYGSTELTFTAWYAELPEGGVEPGDCDVDPAVAWLYCPEFAYESVWTSPDEPAAHHGLYIDPESGVTMPARGQWLRIRGAFDHPDAPLCADADRQFRPEDPNPELAAFDCRAHFVLRAVEPTTAP
jgi:hypothetical protein